MIRCLPPCHVEIEAVNDRRFLLDVAILKKKIAYDYAIFSLCGVYFYEILRNFFKKFKILI